MDAIEALNELLAALEDEWAFIDFSTGMHEGYIDTTLLAECYKAVNRPPPREVYHAGQPLREVEDWKKVHWG